MNKKLITSSLLMLSSLFSTVQAGIVITGTRVIYPNDKEFVSVQLSNVGDKDALVQSWVDTKDMTADPTTTKAPFIVTPPLFRLDPEQTNTLRIQYTGAPLPTDRDTKML